MSKTELDFRKRPSPTMHLCFKVLNGYHIRDCSRSFIAWLFWY
jgi:hypothetical protein